MESERNWPAVLMDLQGSLRYDLRLDASAYLIGRSQDCDFVVPQALVSRRHAELVRSPEGWILRDLESTHGTFVNGQKLSSALLEQGDVIQFGPDPASQFRLVSEAASPSQPANVVAATAEGARDEFAKLNWYCSVANSLSAAESTDLVLETLLKTTLQLARMERGYVFLSDGEGQLRFEAGMDRADRRLDDSATLSQTIMKQAIAGRQDFFLSDTLTAESTSLPESIVAHNIRVVLCIPLWQADNAVARTARHKLLGLLYMDASFKPDFMSDVDRDLLGMIAREAAVLVENARLLTQQEKARRDQEELRIAAAIQRGLMPTHLPSLDFATLEAFSQPCGEVGGDFFDVIETAQQVAVVLADVSGKGIPAALLASTLQGLLYVQLQARASLDEIAKSANDFLCKKGGGKYATLVILRLSAGGILEYINCGHVQPRVCDPGVGSRRLAESNVPVGLFLSAKYVVSTTCLNPGSRVLLVSDGLTEAENARGEAFGEERLDAAASLLDGTGVANEVLRFCQTVAWMDDCTAVHITYSAAGESGATDSYCGVLEQPGHLPTCICSVDDDEGQTSR